MTMGFIVEHVASHGHSVNFNDLFEVACRSAIDSPNQMRRVICFTIHALTAGFHSANLYKQKRPLYNF